GSRTSLTVVTRGAFPGGGAIVVPARAAMAGLLRCVPLELKDVCCRLIDLENDVSTLDVDAARLVDELAVPRADAEGAYRGSRRLVARLEHVDVVREARDEPPIRAGGRYLITGGLGGIGAIVARDLIARFGAHILAVGRTPLPPKPSWPAERARDPNG